MVGPGDYELKLSPRSEDYDTEDSAAGHMMLPRIQFRKASRGHRKEESFVFVVSDYFEGTSCDQCGEPSLAMINDQRTQRAGP